MSQLNEKNVHPVLKYNMILMLTIPVAGNCQIKYRALRIWSKPIVKYEAISDIKEKTKIALKEKHRWFLAVHPCAS